MSKLRYPKEILDVLRARAMAAYPEEACGLISGLVGPRGAIAVGVHAMDNVYDRYREADPEAYPRSNATAYLMDPGRQQALVRALEEGGTPLISIWHSHVDVGSYFSEEDQRGALWDGEPLHPGVEYLVLSARKEGVDAAKAFHWNGEAFEGRDVPLGGRSGGRPGGKRHGRGRRGNRRGRGGRRPEGQDRPGDRSAGREGGDR
ncbi:MAG: M67 family metallopeptidase [Deltaproteobacteria bacterium]|nr:M67 family metallopeptidase [Deltaproteobacteria bacterium]